LSDVVVLGDINLDVLMSIQAYPAPGDDAPAGRIVTRAGGSAANTAVMLSKLGIGVKMIGCVGTDIWADVALSAL
jgi:ribokinase